MKTFEIKLRELTIDATNTVKELILSKGEKSKHDGYLCLKITNEKFMFNLDGDRYLTEINSNNLVDNEGYEYDYHVLDVSKLMTTIDYLIEKYV